MKTIEEMRNEIQKHCYAMSRVECKKCALNKKNNCYLFATDEEIIENHSILFGKEEQKILNIDKYRDEIVHLIQENNGDHLGAITTCCINHCGRCSITLGYSFKWLFEEYKEPFKLTKLEHLLIIKFKEEGFNKLTKCDNSIKMHIYHSNGNSYRLSPMIAFKGLFEFADEIIFEEVLSNCEVVENEELTISKSKV